MCQIYAFVDYLRSKLTPQQFEFLFRTLAIMVGVVTVVVGGALTALGSILVNMSTINSTITITITTAPSPSQFHHHHPSSTITIPPSQSPFHFYSYKSTPSSSPLHLLPGILLNPLLFPEISPWTGRFYSLLDPSYAKNNIPIIASVSEHQPTTWSSFYFDLQFLAFMFPGQDPNHV